ncbi:glycosyltransferase [Kibdelosporangium persicum]|uniref:Glycosyltransferase, catalytic subunit of cellulose synthase and poly-beta-1,6-N-acetylglucosamine synthase n=1 Tax=Kibdelosporangium persicum TaxID=2698649 RepID=A0ABX2F6J2_9PSEU|nr:glycosyltransferase [Kibdelosporangium persicum]NRN66970.1 Glycosyltransferase, catalytic subunit of cellulose synthase and poly-beta-1,6-N-acetylglucosamine synthase [Kibdelosporangium persicum]
MTTDYAVVIPTTGRKSLNVVLHALAKGHGPAPREVIVVDDRPNPEPPLALGDEVRVLYGGGRGPAAARNTGWRATTTEWVAFLDDDVAPPTDWKARLVKDLAELPARVAGSQARIHVPLPNDRHPTDWERSTAGLSVAKWITADIAYRRAALTEVGGFDERFPRAYREDAELALRIIQAGYEITTGDRETTHPVRASDFLASLRVQRGNADDALMRRVHGADWRAKTGAYPTRVRWHMITTAAGAAAVLFGLSGRRKAAWLAGLVWAGLTGQFAYQRIVPGPKTPEELARMVVTSVAIPPAATLHRLRGELGVRRGRAS